MEKWEKLADTVRRIHIALCIFLLVTAAASLPLVICFSAKPTLASRKIILAVIMVATVPSFIVQLAQLIWGGCPLTILENSLRVRAGGKDEPMRSFVADFINRKFNRQVSPESVTVVGLVMLFLSLAAPACVLICSVKP